MKISKEIQFDAGHRVPKHGSKCRNPHGHRYRIIVECVGEIVTEKDAPDEGMLIDFGDLKEMMTVKVHDVLDHGFIVYKSDLTMRAALSQSEEEEGWKIIVFPYIPTAENIARWIWFELDSNIRNHWRGNLKLDTVIVYETPTSIAYYYGEDDTVEGLGNLL